jgi:hypothetical protein
MTDAWWLQYMPLPILGPGDLSPPPLTLQRDRHLRRPSEVADEAFRDTKRRMAEIEDELRHRDAGLEA